MLQHRINYNENIKKNLYTKKVINRCVSFYKLDKDGKPIFRIGNNIILKNQIYNDYTYLCSFRNEYQKLFKFICELQILTFNSNQDLTIQTILSKLVFKCPHYPILCGAFVCKSSDSNFKSLYDFINKYVYKFNSDSFVKSNSKSVSKSKKELPNKVIAALKNKKDLLITFKEYYDGTLLDFMTTNNMNTELIINAFIQINLASLFYYQELGIINNGADFHYHKIEKGGCFHYQIFGKDYYVENVGYLWTINKFASNIKYKDNKLPYKNRYYFPLPNYFYDIFKYFKIFYINLNLKFSTSEIIDINLVIKNLIDEFIKNKFLLTNKRNHEIINKSSPFVLFKDLFKSLKDEEIIPTETDDFKFLKNEEIIPTRSEIFKSFKNKFDFIPDDNDSFSNFYEIFKTKLILEDKIIVSGYCDENSPQTQGDAFAMAKYGIKNKKISHITSFIDKINKFKFITTIIKNYNEDYLKDIKIQEELRTFAIDKCPHFGILYDYKFCSPKSSSKPKSKFITYNNDETLITFSELMDGNLNDMCEKSANYKSHILINAFVQAFLALMFFRVKTRKGHYNCNFCNILYRKTNEGNFYHYKLFDKDYYLYNTGYSFIITNFVKSEKLYYNNTFEDFDELFDNIRDLKNHPNIIREFHNIYGKFDVSSNSNSSSPKITSNYIMKTLIDEFVKLEYLLPKNKIPSDAIIINKSPFILNIIK